MEIEVINHYKQTNMRLLLATVFERLPHFHHDIEIHSSSQTNEPNMFAVLEVSPDFCKSFYPRLANICITENHVTPTSNPELYKCLRNAIRQAAFLCREQDDGNELLIMAGLCKLIFGILKYAKYVERTEEEAQAKFRENKRISSILKYINNNYVQNISLNSLAENLDMNPSYLSRYISKHLGTSFRDYVNNLRLEKAVTLLTTTDMSKLDVCIATGFSDYRYLNSSIQRVYGCAPEELKNTASYNEKYPNKRDSDSKQHYIVDIPIAHETLIEYFEREQDAKILPPS